MALKEIEGVCPDCGRDVMVLCTGVESIRIKAHTRGGYGRFGTPTSRAVPCRVDRARGRDAVECMRDRLSAQVTRAEEALRAAREALRAYAVQMVVVGGSDATGAR